MSAPFKISVVDPQDAEAVTNGGDSLRSLCRKEVEEFDRHMRENDPNWGAGLANWEAQILGTYLYQKLRGRLDPESTPHAVLEEGQDG